jgi:hypothetical protein
VGIKIPFFGIGMAIMTIEAVIRKVKNRNVAGVKCDLKLVFFSFPRFHEYNSKGTDSKSTAVMTAVSFIGISNKDKYSASKDVNAIPITGERNSLSKKSNSSETVACRIEKPGRTKTNKILRARERAEKPPTKNNAQAGKTPISIGVSFRKSIKSASAIHQVQLLYSHAINNVVMTFQSTQSCANSSALKPTETKEQRLWLTMKLQHIRF